MNYSTDGNLRPAKEICTCGHADIEHADLPPGLTIEQAVMLDGIKGQGECLHEECACEQFTWATFAKYP